MLTLRLKRPIKYIDSEEELRQSYKKAMLNTKKIFTRK